MDEQNQEYIVAKDQVARSFSAAAKAYQEVNQLQETVALRLFERLELTRINPGVIVDLGSGPGQSSARLAKHFSKSRVLEADISFAMLKEAGRQAPRFFSRRSRICADAEKLGIKSGSVDLVFSNLMLQWCAHLDLALEEAHRVLQENGLFIFSTFGPDTLMELRQSWAAVDGEVHVNAFVDMHDIGDALIRVGMENPVMESERITVQYKDAFALMHDLKKLGAHNLNAGRRKTLSGKLRLQGMLEEYEKWRTAGKLPATYEIVYGHAWMPARRAAKRLDEQTVAFPVAALKHRHKQ